MADFFQAIPIVLENEGGYVNDPNDPGGETKFGISKRAYPNLDIKNLTKEQAIEIYHRDFWKYDGLTSQVVATKIFDTCVNLGPTGGMKLCQRAAGIPDVDGKYGPHTEGAFNGSEEAQLLGAIRNLLAQHYEAFLAAHPAEEKDRNGLMKRANQ